MKTTPQSTQEVTAQSSRHAYSATWPSEFRAGRAVGPFATHEEFVDTLHKEAKKAGTRKVKVLQRGSASTGWRQQLSINFRYGCPFLWSCI